MQCALGLFVYISGLLLSKRYDLSDMSKIIHFLMLRFLRVYPLFLIALTAFCFLGIEDFSMFTKTAFLTTMILNQRFLTLWFVTMICLFYLILPFYLINYKLYRAIILTLAVYSALFIIHRLFGLIDLRLAQYLIPFAFGIICARSPKFLTRLYKKTTSIIAVLLWIVAVLIASKLEGGIQIFAKDFVIIASIPISLIIAKMLSKVINHKLIRMLSYASYCIYLMHRIIFELALLVYRPENLYVSILYIYLIVLPTIVFVSYWLQYTYDLALGKLMLRLRLYARRATSYGVSASS